MTTITESPLGEKQTIIGRQSFMETLMKNTPIVVPKVDDLVDGIVIGLQASTLYVDLAPLGTGIIYGREYNRAKDIIRSLKSGDKIAVKMIEPENERGYMTLSLKEAKEEIVWREAEEMQKTKAPITLAVKEANKGGLVLEWNGIPGFLPTSQLKSEHYPRVDDGDKDKIETELKKLVGEKLKVTVISSNQKEKKLIFSEKGNDMEEIKEIVSKYKVGDIVEGEITGVVDFGVFIKIDQNLEGLAHISELDWVLIDNPASKFKVGEKVKAQIINITEGKVSLSIKALKTNPWNEAKDKYKTSQEVSGVVIKFNKHGALVSIEEGVAGLVHISGFKSEEDMKEKLDLGKSYKFKIATFEPKDHKLTLLYIGQ
ncbi:TPA: 30S ribosomal protein S1 [Patescibacteria group bacterium]|nr:MAG: RNA binding S1 domain protein [Parcubacteria group bacterium GW2011_GWB2_40_8]HBB56908.1 30S ribosomal protein S1 [Patescibacteria group bacterium]HCI04819.1 30S ribosomal protein S1 [Patescibacteria group bacterium]